MAEHNTKRIVIDGDLCQGTGERRAVSPGSIEFDATGIAHVVEGADVVDAATADRFVAICPSMAISAHPARPRGPRP